MSQPSRLTPDQQQFIAREIAPHTVTLDAEARPIARETLLEAARLGLLGYGFPREVGGAGESLQGWGELLIEIGRVTSDASFALLLSLHAAVAQDVWENASPALRESHGLALIQGRRLGAFAYTEATDAFAMQTSLLADRDAWVLAGEKAMITGGLLADCLVVYARKASGDLAAVVVDRSDPGVELEPLVVAGVRAAGLARLKLHDVQLPATRVLIERDALSHAQRFLNQRRLLLCCAPLGRLRGLLNELVRHLSPRERYGQNVLDFSNVQARLGRMSAAVRAAEIMTRATLERVTRAEHDALWDEDIVATKYFVSEQCQRVADDCMRLLGGDSLRCGLPFERTLRDFWGLLAGAGAQDILEVGLGSSLVTRSRMEYTT